MKTIKIIDLLNKIANGEEVPKQIKYRDNIYEYDDIRHEYYYQVNNCCKYIFSRAVTFDNDDLKIGLNDEVEILEDKPKKIEKIILDYQDNHNQVEINEYIRCSINEVIDKVNYLLEKSDSND